MLNISELFRDGQVIDAIVALMVLEGVGLWLLHVLRGRGPAPTLFVFNLAAGAALLLALHAALKGSSWMVMSLFLLVALCAHLLDLSSRFRGAVAPKAVVQVDPGAVPRTY